MFNSLDYWRDGYRKLYKDYRYFFLRHDEMLEKIKMLESSIDELVYEKMVLKYDLEIMERELSLLRDKNGI